MINNLFIISAKVKYFFFAVHFMNLIYIGIEEALKIEY